MGSGAECRLLHSVLLLAAEARSSEARSSTHEEGESTLKVRLMTMTMMLNGRRPMSEPVLGTG